MKKLKKLAVLMLGLSMLINTTAFAASSEPSVNAESAILVEKETGTVLYEKNADRVMYPASMTKILTSMLLLDHFEKDEVVVVGTEINDISLELCYSKAFSTCSYIKIVPANTECILTGSITLAFSDNGVKGALELKELSNE